MSATVQSEQAKPAQKRRAAFTELIEIMSKDSSRVQPATSLLFAAHDLERIGDRVTNICEDVIYMVTGEIEELN